jgi:hypothetical protein
MDEQLIKLHQVHELLQSGRILMARELLEQILGIAPPPEPSPVLEAA